jgi:GNAT superfamily N-acetyltransferase
VNGVEIGPAAADEVAALPDIERRAATLFPPEILAAADADDVTAVPVYAEAQREGRLLVARDAAHGVVGFAHLEWIDGAAHLEELDVEPAFGRRGIGRRLVGAACAWAAARGSDRITLSTFRDVPWNGPFYARLGFEPVAESELSDALRALRHREALDGLDPAKRFVMVRRLGDWTGPREGAGAARGSTAD